MNKRIKKKVTMAKRKEIHALLDAVLDINGIYARKKETTGDLPTAFFDFSGHIGELSLSVHDFGWIPYISDDFRVRVKASDSKKIREVIQNLKERYV